MRELFRLDKRDYDPAWRHSCRPSARAVIIDGNKLAMVYVSRKGYYKFPGGGINEGETPEQALVREAAEEAGLEIAPESVREYGCVLRLEKSPLYPETIFEQRSLYYLCEARRDLGTQRLDEYESADGFTPVWATPQEIISANLSLPESMGADFTAAQREARVAEILARELMAQNI